MKRIIIAAVVAVVALAGCGGPPPSAKNDLASKIPYTTEADPSHWAIYPSATPPPTDHWVREAHGPGQDIVAVFPTNANRAAWAQRVAGGYAATFGSYRVDGTYDGWPWTVITSGGPWNLDDAVKALNGTKVLIRSK